MRRYNSLSDDFYFNMNLNTEMELPQNRETLLHFFEIIQKHYPKMRNFYSRERTEYVLEEDKDQGSYRWATVELKRVCSGQVNPSSYDDAYAQHALLLDILPYALSVSPLDCESLNLMLGFDFTYRGNHNELVAEALGMPAAFDTFGEKTGGAIINYEPSIQIAMDESCKTQCRLGIETRTNAFNVRSGEFPEEQLSVYLTVRHYGTLDPQESFVDVFKRLSGICQEVVEDYVIDHVLVPLQHAIAIK